MDETGSSFAYAVTSAELLSILLPVKKKLSSVPFIAELSTMAASLVGDVGSTG